MLKKPSDQIAFCYQRASECRAKAADASNEAVRQEYLDIEHRWVLLASRYELSERGTDYLSEIDRRLQAAVSEYPSLVVCPKCSKRMRLATTEPLDGPQSGDRATYLCQCGFKYEIELDRQVGSLIFRNVWHKREL
jgi:hypothetical protein